MEFNHWIISDAWTRIHISPDVCLLFLWLWWHVVQAKGVIYSLAIVVFVSVCVFFLSVSVYPFRHAGTRRRDGTLEGWLLRVECRHHIQLLWLLLLLPLDCKKGLEDQHLPLRLFWHALYVLPMFSILPFWFIWLTFWVSWQVMYDATGVRLHAGRQAEVRFFFSVNHHTLVFCIWISPHYYQAICPSLGG